MPFLFWNSTKWNSQRFTILFRSFTRVVVWIRVKVGQRAALVLVLVLVRVLCRVICAQVMEREPAGKYLFLDCLVQQLPLEPFDAIARVARAGRHHDFDLLDYLAAPLHTLHFNVTGLAADLRPRQVTSVTAR